MVVCLSITTWTTELPDEPANDVLVFLADGRDFIDFHVILEKVLLARPPARLPLSSIGGSTAMHDGSLDIRELDRESSVLVLEERRVYHGAQASTYGTHD